MRVHLESQTPYLLFALVSVSALASLPQVESAWNGVKEVYGEQDFGLRILRELTLVLVLGWAALDPRFWRMLATSKVSAFLLVLAAYCLAETGYAIYLGLPSVVPLAGLRVFEYLPIALLGYLIAQLNAGVKVLATFVKLLRLYVLLQACLAVTQALWAPALFGVSLLGGGRPFGTFVSPNLFGAAMSTCTLFFALARLPGHGKWMALSLFLALLSGSRTAFMTGMLVVFFQIYQNTRARDRWALWLPAPLLAAGALILASSPLLSGREDADLSKEGRLTLWQNLLSSQINDTADLLFGWGLGLGSNTVNVVFGEGHFPGQFDSDSLYLYLLNGYGLLGLLAYLAFVGFSVKLSGFRQRGLAMTFIFVAGLPFNLWEYFPQNAMLMFLWGLVLGTDRTSVGWAERSVPIGAPNDGHAYGFAHPAEDER
ncbi:O-antigen ligase family protein [Methylococcus sp. EFPC2]|uniref:O-antigen ligase family protein n=1 Tax=Methylococcus sp. EFPC2 TaxID=2812648 RepID=UPI0019674E35|nr:O-antigen ligase family protein [Methylococcus sp. EFPC2]QSA98580.1 O-antigen ligase family protein [Methylococcus sp. EFPC2]